MSLVFAREDRERLWPSFGIELLLDEKKFGRFSSLGIIIFKMFEK